MATPLYKGAGASYANIGVKTRAIQQVKSGGKEVTLITTQIQLLLQNVSRPKIPIPPDSPG